MGDLVLSSSQSGCVMCFSIHITASFDELDGAEIHQGY